MGASLERVKVNGVEVTSIFEESRNIPIVSLQLVFTVSGSIADGNSSGLASITSSLLNEGSRGYGSDKFSEMLDERAIHYSSGVGRETFVFHLDSLKENFGRGIELLKEVIKDPNLDEKVLERVKKRAISSILQKQSNYDYVASNELRASLFKDTPLQNPKSGTVESIEKITLQDIREFIRDHIVIERVIPVIGGDLTVESAKSYISDILRVLPHGESVKTPEFRVAKRSDNTIYRESKQAYIYFGSPLNIRYDSDELYKAKVMFFILGASGFGSRLMEKIRVEKGLAYSVYASSSINRTGSHFSGHLQTKVENLEDAKVIVKSEIESFLKGGATEEELESAKLFILGSEPLRNEKLSSRLSRSFNEFYRGRELGYSVSELNSIENLTLRELNSFISSHSEISELSFTVLTDREEQK
jgi:predicted Zn-dependent peptidase